MAPGATTGGSDRLERDPHAVPLLERQRNQRLLHRAGEASGDSTGGATG